MPGPWFGAAAFDGRSWDGFSPLRFTLPALLRWSDGERHFAAAFGPGARHRLDESRRAAERRSDPELVVSRRVRQPGERERWTALVSRALTAIDAGALEKVVVARAIEVETDAPIDPAALLSRLEQRHPACRAFLVRGDEGSAFVGATPELLCRVDGDLVTTEALAGSADPGHGADLLASGKDLREHRWVVDHIVGALGGVARSVQCRPEPRVRALANVIHLHTPISARLAPGRGVADVAAALHPTPAVLGVPAAAARRFLAEHEGIERGLYAGVVGWAGPRRAELAVALRCALIRGNRARLFVGAGIVDGSSAEREWEETEMKARALLDALGVAE
jgi:isochorismate synthase